jgi:hypothetical protein
MKKLFPLLLMSIFAACNANLSAGELKETLKTTMNDYLYKSVNYDSSKVKYRVQDVIYYDDKNYYDCEFDVLMMVTDERDSLGKMNAKISKDFKTVLRNY